MENTLKRKLLKQDINLNQNTTVTSQDNELMRFGHTVNLSNLNKTYKFLFIYFTVNKQHAVLFGGARGSSTQYDIRDDTYLFKIQEQMWMKLNRKLRSIILKI